MEWKEEYSVGIHEMDVQHQALARCITLVENSVTTKQQLSIVQSALAQLTDVVRIHFAVEESLMRIHGYSEFERHADEHLKFTDQLRQLQEKSLREEASEEMLANLPKWLRVHITVSDKHYAAHFSIAKIVTEGPIRRKFTGLEPACGPENSGVAGGCIVGAEAIRRGSERQYQLDGATVREWELDGTAKAYLDGLTRSIKCSKDFACAKSNFETLCRARDVGLQSNLVCLEHDCPECGYRVKSDVAQFCQCPIRVFLGRTSRASPLSAFPVQ